MIRHVAAAAGALSPAHEAVLPVVADVFSAATRRWLAGVSSPAQARFEIRLGCRLLDLPDEVLDERACRTAEPSQQLSRGVAVSPPAPG